MEKKLKKIKLLVSECFEIELNYHDNSMVSILENRSQDIERVYKIINSKEHQEIYNKVLDDIQNKLTNIINKNREC